MKYENYLYFANSGQNDADKDAVMYPASNVTGIATVQEQGIEIYFLPRDGSVTIPDGVLIEYVSLADTTENTVFDSFSRITSLINRNFKNNDNFTVVADFNTNLPVSGDPGVSSTGIVAEENLAGITITTH
tara:strand:- start:74 stop:466 length:393 start_codon:yes stop_codon:yes gene_type:complete